jgi:hypothetical protein
LLNRRPEIEFPQACVVGFGYYIEGLKNAEVRGKTLEQSLNSFEVAGDELVVGVTGVDFSSVVAGLAAGGRFVVGPVGDASALFDALGRVLDEAQKLTRTSWWTVSVAADFVGVPVLVRRTAGPKVADLVGQMRHVYLEDEHRRRELSQLLRDVTRDEVEVID